MHDARAERLAMNEALFRDVNELIKKEQARQRDERAAFVCECAKVTCQLHLRVTVQEYAVVRANPAHFMVFPGHEQPEIEIVVGGAPPRYLVVEKIGPGRVVATGS